ncbi:C45 family peptidase [Flammeovirga kamogawensis]|uniref:C45 family peptidase n=1 Tax=Flammeovirga kamogawensis TaxID=373891 RepID=A0ABX8GRI2_9BACT|nr:C45 family peptidase [Flammeovirga kamogawensis]MBB6463693.1 hypothetical protein [Flammeovirga kamogawensis]QWG06193.1 C45 family peptidase [Flammeovirga kamogawensis]TRX68024.1 hypothetical protein EO216_07690 [Flammeovirga kamogawensis]
MRKLGIALSLLILILIVWVESWINIPHPTISDTSITTLKVDTLSSTRFVLKNNFINKKKEGIWELYTEGTPFEIGYSTGKLSQDILQQQERVFIEKISEKSPSKSIGVIRVLNAMYNRHLDNRILPEYCKEMYGISLNASTKYNDFGTPYQRILNYHGIYDIEHSFEDVEVKGNTAFAIKGKKTLDNDVLIGRNFDFSLGKEFDQQKIIHFVKPQEGFKYASISWGGFIGAVSGMNETGLTVSINAVESKFPLAATMPMSLIAREILQYALTVDEAYNIAFTKEAYISESILVSSAFDTTAILIEKTPTGIDSLHMRTDELIVTNHLQTPSLHPAKVYNEENATQYRAIRLTELLAERQHLSVIDIARILRDTKGIENQNIGYGNQKSINTLNLHHSVIFKPLSKEMWVAAHHSQLDEYICYNLDSVFQGAENYPPPISLSITNKHIPKDEFIETTDFKNYATFKALATKYKNWNYELEKLTDNEIQEFIQLNPEAYESYEIIGDYYAKNNNWKTAAEYYQMALSKEVATLKSKKELQEKVSVTVK